jgi:hypothetical protein
VALINCPYRRYIQYLCRHGRNQAVEQGFQRGTLCFRKNTCQMLRCVRTYTDNKIALNAVWIWKLLCVELVDLRDLI